MSSKLILQSGLSFQIVWLWEAEARDLASSLNLSTWLFYFLDIVFTAACDYVTGSALECLLYFHLPSWGHGRARQLGCSAIIHILLFLVHRLDDGTAQVSFRLIMQALDELGSPGGCSCLRLTKWLLRSSIAVCAILKVDPENVCLLQFSHSPDPSNWTFPQHKSRAIE